MKKQMIGIALILFGIILVIPYEFFYGWNMTIGAVIGAIGLIMVIANSGNEQEK